MALTFDPKWLADRGVTATGMLPLPGAPILIVQHAIEGVLYEFMAKIPRPPNPADPQQVLEAAMGQVEAGIAERHRLLALARSEAVRAPAEDPPAGQ